MTSGKPSCRICRERPIYCKEQCRRCYNRNWARRSRAQYPIRECTACHRERPIQRYGWCESCVTRWQQAGRPADGPPPLMDPDELQKIRQRIALEGRASQALTAAIRRGGWEWVA